MRICAWKALEKDPDSSTFEEIRQLPPEEKVKHPLYKCTVCDGYDTECDRYYPVKRPHLKKGK